VVFLTGPASQDYAEYSRGLAGALALLGYMLRFYTHGVGLAAVVLVVLGISALVLRARGAARVAGLLPLLAGISFTLCFNLAALRTDDRFLLPQALMACVYIGIGCAFVLQARPLLRIGAAMVLAVTGLFSLHQAMAVDATMLLDPRYDAERWMAAHVRPGDTVETYGQNCFLPRFPKAARVSRVGQGDLKLRNPLPGVTELLEPFRVRRDPRFIVVSGSWVRRYLRPQLMPKPGRIYSRLQQADFRNVDARGYFAALDGGRLPYRLVHVARYQSSIWPAMHIHDSLAEPIGIYERVP
jgi:hypothetical protein